MQYHTSEKFWIFLHNDYTLTVMAVAQVPDDECLRMDILLAAD